MKKDCFSLLTFKKGLKVLTPARVFFFLLMTCFGQLALSGCGPSNVSQEQSDAMPNGSTDPSEQQQSNTDSHSQQSQTCVQKLVEGVSATVRQLWTRMQNKHPESEPPTRGFRCLHQDNQWTPCQHAHLPLGKPWFDANYPSISATRKPIPQQFPTHNKFQMNQLITFTPNDDHHKRKGRGRNTRFTVAQSGKDLPKTQSLVPIKRRSLGISTTERPESRACYQGNPSFPLSLEGSETFERLDDEQRHQQKIVETLRVDLPPEEPWLAANYLSMEATRKPTPQQLQAYYQDVVAQLTSHQPITFTPSDYRHKPTRRILLLGVHGQGRTSLVNTLFTAAQSEEDLPKAQWLVPIERRSLEVSATERPEGETYFYYPPRAQLNQQDVEVHCYASLYQPIFRFYTDASLSQTRAFIGYVFQDQHSGEYIELIDTPGIHDGVGFMMDDKLHRAIRDFLRQEEIHHLVFVGSACAREDSAHIISTIIPYGYHDMMASVLGHCAWQDIAAGRVHLVLNKCGDAELETASYALKNILQQLGRWPSSMPMDVGQFEPLFYHINCGFHQAHIDVDEEIELSQAMMYKQARLLLAKLTSSPPLPLDNAIHQYTQQVAEIARLLAPKILCIKRDIHRFDFQHDIKFLQEKHQKDMDRLTEIKILRDQGWAPVAQEEIAATWLKESTDLLAKRQALVAAAKQHDEAIASMYHQLQQHPAFVDFHTFYRQLFYPLCLEVQWLMVDEKIQALIDEKTLCGIHPLNGNVLYRFTKYDVVEALAEIVGVDALMPGCQGRIPFSRWTKDEMKKIASFWKENDVCM